jgi:ribosome biogenesis GTPase / thiamine phosphate phosphatase
VQSLAARCRFADCRHQSEPGCAIAAALASGELDAERLASYSKLEREQRYVEERHAHSRREAQRRFSKMITRANRQKAKSPLGK